ncbi:MAG: DUF58 domain-containing protein [Deltaproteobacteria bacterium]|nr:DUF58 domain-containing protein [Deltaproteobacteria bacterium]
MSESFGQKLRRWLRPPRRLKVTRQGKVFILVTIGVGIAAINTANNLLFLVLGFMLSLIVISGILSEAVLRHIEIRRRLPTLPWAGEPCPIEITVKNVKRIPSYCLEIQDLSSNFVINRRCFFLKVSGKKSQSTTYHCVFPKRGSYHFTGYKVITRFPFSLFAKSYFYKSPDDFIVAPRRVPPRRPPVDEREIGEEASGREPDRLDPEPALLHPYNPGDDVRRINWKLSAKRQRLVVTEGVRRSRKRINLLFDDRLAVERFRGSGARHPTMPDRMMEHVQAMAREAFEDAVNEAASTGFELSQQDYELWFGTRRKVFGPIQPEQFHVILLEFALMEPIPGPETDVPPMPVPPAGATIEFHTGDADHEPLPARVEIRLSAESLRPPRPGEQG